VLAAVLLLSVVFGVLWATNAFDHSLETSSVAAKTPKLGRTLTFAVLSDHHSCDYGKGQAELVDAVRAARPDAVLMVGDMADDKLPDDNALELCEILGKEYPCYYVTGNHEWWSGHAADIKKQFARRNITVLAGTTQELTLEGECVQISGVDDPAGEHFDEQLTAVAQRRDPARFSILLSHRPERIARYEKAGFDLVVAGHAHGGQWRLPGFNRGLIAPNQGLLPKYVNGLYQAGDTTMLVTRGLARESTRIPRLYNRPELVVLSVEPGE